LEEKLKKKLVYVFLKEVERGKPLDVDVICELEN
jgi:hypothetical protein